MEQKTKKNSTKKTLVIVGVIFAGIILCYAAYAVYMYALVDHTTKEYNKAYDRAQRDLDRTLRQYRY